MHVNSPVRSSGFIWGVRIVQAIFAITLLSITAQDASVWHSLDCTTPTKLAYHIAMVSFHTFDTPTTINLVLGCHHSPPPRLLPPRVSLTKFWSAWVQIILDAIFVIFWIVAAALSSYDCNGLCSSCSAGGAQVDIGAGFVVWVGSLTCECVFADDFWAGSRLFRRSVGSSVVKTAEKASNIAAKQGLDGTMM